MTDYIKSLRKKVGHAPIMQCGGSVIVINEKNEILLEKRRDNGCWGYAGGSVELNEIVEETAKRELFEETGLAANKLELYGVFSGPELYYIYPNGDEVSNIDIVYICRDYDGELKCEEDEVSELRFFPLDKIPENISPPNRAVIEKFISENLKSDIYI